MAEGNARKRVLLDPYRPQYQQQSTIHSVSTSNNQHYMNQHPSYASNATPNASLKANFNANPNVHSNARIQGTSSLYSSLSPVTGGPLMGEPLMGQPLTGPPFMMGAKSKHLQRGTQYLKERYHGAKNHLKAAIANWQVVLMAIVQYVFWVVHLSAWVCILYIWLSAANHPSGKGAFLKQKSYFTTDQISASLHMGSRGYVLALGDGIANTEDVEFYNTTTSPYVGKRRLPIFNTLSILDYMQPVTVKRNATSFFMTPSACSKLNFTDSNNSIKVATDMDTSSWKACRVQTIPFPFLDVAHAFNSHVWFSSNNPFFLIYNTIFVTWCLCTAYLPFIDRRIWGIGTGSMWIWVAFIALFCNMGFIIMIPHSWPQFNVPVNNVAICAHLHLCALVMLALVARQKDKAVVSSSANHFAKQYFGYRILPDGLGIQHLWRTSTGNHLVTQTVLHEGSASGSSLASMEGGFSGPTANEKSSAHHNVKAWVQPHTQKCKDISQAIFSRDEDDDNLGDGSGGAEDDSVPPLQSLQHHSEVDLASATDGIEFFTADGNIVQTAFYQDRLFNHMDVVALKYFEYALTAGLFLSATLMSFYPNGNTHEYQTCMRGMVACNLVAIPMHKLVLFGTRLAVDPRLKHIQDAISAAGAVFLLASWILFFGGMIPFFSVSSFASADGVPSFVYTIYISMIGAFCAFGVWGTIFTGVLIWNQGMRKFVAASIEEATNKKKAFAKTYVYWLTLGFEFFNVIKAAIAFVIMSASMNSVGFV